MRLKPSSRATALTSSTKRQQTGYKHRTTATYAVRSPASNLWLHRIKACGGIIIPGQCVQTLISPLKRKKNAVQDRLQARSDSLFALDKRHHFSRGLAGNVRSSQAGPSSGREGRELGDDRRETLGLFQSPAAINLRPSETLLFFLFPELLAAPAGREATIQARTPTAVYCSIRQHCSPHPFPIHVEPAVAPSSVFPAGRGGSRRC